jgi:pimeloyl-ACP methyl ester carboxylesterase
MTEDAESAWRYLHSTRGLREPQIVPYGVGVGASLAAHLASSHPRIPVVILDSPQADLLETLLHDPRAGLLPARLLFHENFPLSQPLSSLRTPKLLLSGDKPSTAFKTAAAPKFAVEFKAAPGTLSSQPNFLPSIRFFLDQYLPPASAPQLIPAPAEAQP